MAIDHHTNKWKEAFLKLKELTKLDLIHIGSTSIPEMMAKPLLDILITYKNVDDLKRITQQLELHGFTYRGDRISQVYDRKERSYYHNLTFYDTNTRVSYANIHLIKEGAPEIGRLLKFRDRLVKDRLLKRRYEDFKKDMLFKISERKEFARSKDQFIKSSIEE